MVDSLETIYNSNERFKSKSNSFMVLGYGLSFEILKEGESLIFNIRFTLSKYPLDFHLYIKDDKNILLDKKYTNFLDTSNNLNFRLIKDNYFPKESVRRELLFSKNPYSFTESDVTNRMVRIREYVEFFDKHIKDFITLNNRTLSQLDPHCIKELYLLMYKDQTDKYNTRFFRDCENKDNCIYFRKGSCKFSHHDIQKRVFQTQLNGNDLFINAKNNCLRHLSILLGVKREDLNKIANLNIQILEIP